MGLIRLNQTAHLQIDAYPYTQWGLISANVTALAEDSSAASSTSITSGFKVTLRPAVTALRLQSGISGPLRKGMTLNARFVVARRSLLQLLSENFSAWVDP